MLPTFTAFARMATGNNKVTVRLGKQGAETDGSIIWIFPPISLGLERVHERSKCDRRGEDKRQTCKACDAREVSLFHLFHEIAHIAFDSVVQPLQYISDKMEDMINEWHPTDACYHAGYLKAQLGLANDYMRLCGVHNQFMPMLFNVLEDARVNARMFRARPGLKVMFEAGTARVFTEGVETSTGERFPWNEAKPNPAILVGLFLVASGYQVKPGYLSEQVTEDLRDPELQRICGRVVTANSSHQIMELTYEAFSRLNEMGYCEVPKCVAAPPVPPPPPAPSEPDDEEQDANQPVDDDAQPEPGDDGSASPADPGQGDPEDSDGGSDGSSGGDDGESGHQPSSDDESNDDSSGSEPESDPSGEHKEGSGGGEGDETGDPDPDGEETDPPVDDPNRGTGDIDDSSEGEGGVGDPSSDGGDDEAPAPARGAGTLDDGTGEDNDELDPPSDQGSPSKGATEDGDSSDSGADEGDEDGDAASPGSEDDDQESEGDGDEGQGEDEDDDWSDALESHDAEDQVTDESVWDDPSASEAAERQYEKEDQPSSMDWGTPDEVTDIVKAFGGHEETDDFDPDDSGINHTHFGDEDHEHESKSERQNRELGEREAVESALKQAPWFDEVSRNLSGIEVVTYPKPSIWWPRGRTSQTWRDFMPGEAVIGKAVLMARLVFENNRRATNMHNLKSGRVDSRALAKRAPFGDPRMFTKRYVPGKRDYFFVIGVDCSGSTQDFQRNPRIKRAVMAQASVMNRLGVKFAIYGMTGGCDINEPRRWGSYGDRDSMWMLEIKKPDEPWNETTMNRLAHMSPVASNFDGHNVQFFRKILDTRSETVRGILYYTDGEMPAANPDEEAIVLADEIAICRQRGYTLLGVGMNTDSPRQYGLDTVQIDSDDDVTKVVDQLGRVLT